MEPSREYPFLFKAVGQAWLNRADNHPLRLYVLSSAAPSKAIAKNIELLLAKLESRLAALQWKRICANLKSASMFQSALSEIYIGNHLLTAARELSYEANTDRRHPDWMLKLGSEEVVYVEVHCPPYPSLRNLLHDRVSALADLYHLENARIQFTVLRSDVDPHEMSKTCHGMVEGLKRTWRKTNFTNTPLEHRDDNWVVRISPRDSAGTLIVGGSAAEEVMPPEFVLPIWIQSILDSKVHQIPPCGSSIIAIDASLAHSQFSSIKWPYVFEACRTKVQLPPKIMAVVIFYRDIDREVVNVEATLVGKGNRRALEILQELQLASKLPGWQ